MRNQTILTQQPNLQGHPSISEFAKQLRFALNAIYGTDDRMSEQEALSVVEALAVEEYPAAMFELGLLYWKGFVVDQNHKRAFRLISKAVEAGFIPAMSSLGGLYFSGIGCEKNFDKAMHWYEQSEVQEQGYYNERIGAVALSKTEFRREFTVSLNDINRSLPSAFLEKLNQWRLACKREVVSEQSATLCRNPTAFFGTHKRCLPFNNSLGDSCLKFAGQHSIEQIGWRNSWLDEEIWFSLTELGFKPSELPPFSLMNRLAINDNGVAWSLDQETCQRIRVAVSQPVPKQREKSMEITQQASPDVLELSVIFTSDGAMGGFGFRGDLELLSFDDTHRKLLRYSN